MADTHFSSEQTTATYTPEQLQAMVDAICNSMLANNDKISVRNVIERLDGAITSTSTASKYLSDWRARKDAQAKELFESSGFSAELTHAFVSEIGRHAAAAEERTASRQRELVDQLAEVNAELGKQERLAQQYKALSDEKDKTLIALEQRMELESQDHQNEIQSLIKDHEHALDKAQSQAEQQIKALEAQLAEAKADAAKQVEAAETKSKADAQTIESLRQSLAQAQVKVEALEKTEAERDTAEADLAEARVALAGAQKEIEGKDRLITQIENAGAKTDAAAAKVEADLREQIKDLRAELAQVRQSPTPESEPAKPATKKPAARKRAGNKTAASKPATKAAEATIPETTRDADTIDAFDGQTDNEKKKAAPSKKKSSKSIFGDDGHI